MIFFLLVKKFMVSKQNPTDIVVGLRVVNSAEQCIPMWKYPREGIACRKAVCWPRGFSLSWLLSYSLKPNSHWATEFTQSGDCRFLAYIPSCMMEKSALAGEGAVGARPPPFSLLPSRTKWQRGQIHSLYIISTLCVLCGWSKDPSYTGLEPFTSPPHVPSG